LIVPHALSTRVTYRHMGLARELAAIRVCEHPQQKNRATCPAVSLLDRCLEVSENLLRGTTNRIEVNPEFAKIADVLTAATEGQRKHERRTGYATASLHFVERMLGLTQLPSVRKIRTAGKNIGFTDERRRARPCGTYSTPDFIVQAMFEELFSAIDKDKKAQVAILDLSLEAGHFALAAKSWVSPKRVIRFYGVDRDPVAVEIASQILQFVSRSEKSNNFHFLCSSQDSFFDPLPPSWPRQYTAVIGNPPWAARKPEVSDLLREKFWPLLRSHYDVYLAFIVQAHRLLKPGGYLSYVVPSGFLCNQTATPIRQLLLEEYEILSVTSYPQRSFIEVPCLIPVSFLARKKRQRDSVNLPTRIISQDVGLGGPDRPRGVQRGTFTENWKKLPSFVINPLARADTKFLISGLCGVPLAELGKVCSGARLSRTRPRCPSQGFLGVHARDLRPYHACLRSSTRYPSREAVFDRPPHTDAIESEKVVFQELRYMTHRQRLVAAVSSRGTHPVSTAALFLPNDRRYVHFFAALFNSALANAWYKLRDLNRAIKISYLRQLPVPWDIRRWRRIDRVARRCARLRTFLHGHLESCTLRDEHETLVTRFPKWMARLGKYQEQIDVEVFDLYKVSKARRSIALRVATARVF
jgi:tRNA1(Val) A37 N6-methylase TrmN6